MIASSPRAARICCMASAVGRASKLAQAHGSDLPQRADARLRVDLVLRQHHGRRAEPLDDRAHEGPDRRAWSPAPAARRASRAPRTRRAARWMNCCSSDGAMASWRSSPWPTRRLGEGLLPVRRQGEDRDEAGFGGAGVADLAGQPGADMLDDQHGALASTPSASPIASRIGGRSRIETRSASRPCSTRWMPAVVIRPGPGRPAASGTRPAARPAASASRRRRAARPCCP